MKPASPDHSEEETGGVAASRHEGGERRAHHAAAPGGRGGERGGGRGERGVVAHGRPEPLEDEVAAVDGPRLRRRGWGLRVRVAPPPPLERGGGGGHLDARAPAGEPPGEQEHERPRGVGEREQQDDRAAPPQAAAGARAAPRGGLAH